MPLTHATGNMYSWVTHCHTHLRGACPHACAYCYVRAMARRFPRLRDLYTGPIRIDPAELDIPYGGGKTIFLEHLHDLFADAIPAKYIRAILDHACAWSGNRYILQTKNPARIGRLLDTHVPISNALTSGLFIVGTTIETNRTCDAPIRAMALRILKSTFGFRTFLTIEPIQAFDEKALLMLIIHANPDTINIGADSKRHRLPEPTPAALRDLIAALDQLPEVTVNLKPNLHRILNP